MSFSWETKHFLNLIKSQDITAGDLRIGDIIVGNFPMMVDWVEDDDERYISFFDEDDNGYISMLKETKITIIDRTCLKNTNVIDWNKVRGSKTKRKEK